MTISLWWCAHRGRAGSLWENRQRLICYDMDTQLDQWVQILQSAVRCQAALRGSSTGSEPVTHHIKITGESEAFFLSNHFSLQGVGFADEPLYFTLLTPSMLSSCFLGRVKINVLGFIRKPRQRHKMSLNSRHFKMLRILFIYMSIICCRCCSYTTSRWKLREVALHTKPNDVIFFLFFFAVDRIVFKALQEKEGVWWRRWWWWWFGGRGVGVGGANKDSF